MLMLAETLGSKRLQVGCYIILLTSWGTVLFPLAMYDRRIWIMQLCICYILYTTQWRHIDTFVSVTSAVLTMFNRRARSLLTNTACDRVQNRFNYSVSCIYGTIFDPYLPRFDDWGQSLFKGRGVVSFSVQNPSAGENSPHFHPSIHLP